MFLTYCWHVYLQLMAPLRQIHYYPTQMPVTKLTIDKSLIPPPCFYSYKLMTSCNPSLTDTISIQSSTPHHVKSSQLLMHTLALLHFIHNKILLESAYTMPAVTETTSGYWIVERSCTCRNKGSFTLPVTNCTGEI